MLWSARIVLPDLSGHCLIVSRQFLPVFPFRCALLAQRLGSNRPFSRRVVNPSSNISIPSVPFPVSSCVARAAFPSRFPPAFSPFRSVFRFIVRRSPVLLAPSAPSPVSLRFVLPALYHGLAVFRFNLTWLRSTLDTL